MNDKTNTTGLLYETTYVSIPYPSYITFYSDGAYTLNINLFTGYSYDFGKYTILDNQIICNVSKRDWNGFTGDDVYTYSFYIIDNSHLEFHLVDALGKKTSSVDGFGVLENGFTLFPDK